MDILKAVKREIISTEQIDIKIEDNTIEADSWQYPQNINAVKQEVVSTGQIDIEIKYQIIESEPWQGSQSIKLEMDLSKTNNKPFTCVQCGKSFT